MRNVETRYAPQARIPLNHWGPGGSWKVGAEKAVLRTATGKIFFPFHIRYLHIVLGPPRNGKPVHFVVKLDGIAPGENCGVDCDADGAGEIKEARHYQLIRRIGRVADRTLEIDFTMPASAHTHSRSARDRYCRKGQNYELPLHGKVDSGNARAWLEAPYVFPAPS